MTAAVDEPAGVALWFRLGDTWSSPDTWAVLINGGPVDLTTNGWRAQAQARARPDSEPLVTWSSDNTTGPRIVLGQATVTLFDGTQVLTSTVRLRHGPESRRWPAFTGALFDCEIIRRPVPDPDPAADPLENYTILSGRITARRDVSR
jgi:hypothetical protein